MSSDKKKKGGFLKNALKLVKNKVKKEVSKESLKQRAADFVKGKVEDGAKSKRSKRQKAVDKATKRPGSDIQVSKTIELGGAKKRRQKKKIQSWKNANKSNKKTEQQKFLEMDRKFKNK